MTDSEKSRVSTDIDFDKDGKQTSYLHVPHSRDTSGWGTLLMPIHVIKNGEGPTIMFTAGNHGDEYEGQVALLKLARSLEADRIQGRVIIIPALNFPAAIAGKRLSPIDGKNMNRIFPGHRTGTITEVIAHYVYTEIVPMVDAAYDLHSGGYSMLMVPSVMIHFLSDEKHMADSVAAMKAFRAPVGLIAEEPDTAGMLDSTVEETGKIFIGTELGGGAILTPETIRITETGIQNALKHFDMIEGELETPTWRGKSESRVMEVPDHSYFTMAMADGLYEPFYELGEDIPAGAAVGQVHFIDSPDRPPTVLHTESGGMLYSRRAPGRCEMGDIVAVVARPAD